MKSNSKLKLNARIFNSKTEQYSLRANNFLSLFGTAYFFPVHQRSLTDEPCCDPPSSPSEITSSCYNASDSGKCE